jgi:hypothetical protein
MPILSTFSSLSIRSFQNLISGIYQWVLKIKIPNPNPNPSQAEFFGYDVAISGDGSTAIMGSSLPNPNGIYVYTLGNPTWYQQAQIPCPDSHGFGAVSLALSNDGNTALIGNPSFSDGIVYVFVRTGTTWTQQAKIFNPDPEPLLFESFGVSVSLSSDGNTALIGDGNSYINSVNSGSFYVYVRTGTTWTQQAKISNPEPNANSESFGNSVALSADGNTAVIGNPLDDSTITNIGSIYIYNRTGATWGLATKISNPDPFANDKFGVSVDISGDGNIIIIGATGDTINSTSNVGSVYIYVKNSGTWSRQTQIINPNLLGEGFGWDVSVNYNGNIAVIGSRDSKLPFGSIYVYTRTGTTWTKETQIIDPNSNNNNQNGFGTAVSIDGLGKTIVAGAYADNFGNNSADGSVYIFDTP